MKRKPNKKIIVPVVLVVLICAIVLAVQISGNKVTGTMEATVVANVAEVAGKLVEVPIAIGQYVSEGEVIAYIDATDQEYAVKQLEIQLEQSMLALGQSQGGSGSASGNALLAAQAGYNSAAAAANQARNDYQRTLGLYNEGAVTKAVLDQAKLAADTAAQAANSAKANLSNASSTYSEENSQLSVAKVQVQLDQARERLDKYTVKAACDGTIISSSYSEGTMVAVGSDIADISSQSERFLVAYISVDEIDKYNFDQTLTVQFNGEEYEGVIKYIDVKSEYTPKELQTAANKSKKSIKIKLLMPESCPMKPGQSADIILP